MHSQKKQSWSNRRSFLSGLLGLIIGTVFPPKTNATIKIEDNPLSLFPTLAGYRPKVFSAWIPKDQRPKDLLSSIIERVSDFSWLGRGDKVLIKLALNSGNPFPATSDPWTLECLIDILREKGAGEIIVGDQSGIANVDWRGNKKKGSSRKLCHESGLMEVIERKKATAIFFEEAGQSSYFRTQPKPNHHWSTPLYITKAVLKADHIIYLPRVGSHFLGEITAGFKLGVGFLREDSRGNLHRGGEYFNAMYEEINEIPEIKTRFRFSLTSGRLVLATMGPDRGTITKPERGLVFASEDLLAGELLAYAWLQWNRDMETSFFSRDILPKTANIRSFANKQFVKMTWGPDQKEPSRGISQFRPGIIYWHPAILNHMRRLGGRPELIDWQQVNPIINHPPDAYIRDKLRS
ncbi:MAG: DUF362 domain-containing protein [Deltaproteobacteria bacterium]|nr:DUF362 domain-containing protein [Deltaproteobacteria bacterium]